jgi:NhaP-type Na+/H+ or K+/H+ antiporter
MAQAVLSFNEQLDHIGEVAVVLLVGGMLAIYGLPSGAALLICLLLLVIRPAAVLLGLVGSDTGRLERGLTSWFGIRGIGSIYYLSYAIEHGLPEELAEPLVAVTLTTVAVSVFAHGLSATPIISRYFPRAPAPAPAAGGRDVPG